MIKSFYYIMISLLFIPSVAQAADSYAEEVEESCSQYQGMLADVAKTMEEIKVLYADDPETLQRIVLSQDAWEDYLHKHIDAMYHGGTAEVGSVHILCICDLMKSTVQDRLYQLHYWRDGAEEGDVCSGHVRRLYGNPEP